MTHNELHTETMEVRNKWEERIREMMEMDIEDWIFWVTIVYTYHCTYQLKQIKKQHYGRI